MILFTSVIDGGVIGLCIVLLLGEVGAFVVNGNYPYHRVLCLFISLLSGVIFYAYIDGICVMINVPPGSIIMRLIIINMKTVSYIHAGDIDGVKDDNTGL